jgi:hypothetical protein
MCIKLLLGRYRADVGLVAFLLSLSSMGRSENRDPPQKKIHIKQIAPAVSEESRKRRRDAGDVDDREQEQMPRSMRYRSSKKFSVLAEIGLVNILGFGSGVVGGYFLNPQQMVEGELFAASFGFMEEGFKSVTILGRGRWFLGNSFNLSAGAGLRQYSVVNSSWLSSANRKSNFSASEIAIDGQLGNRWQIGAFTIGCDWVGFMTALATLSTSESHEDGVSESDKESRRSSFDDRRKSLMLYLTRFQIGAAF